MMSKPEIDNWFSDNYKELSIIVKGMAAKNDKLKHWSDLFSNTYLYVIDMPHKTELDLRRTAINYAKMQLQWSNTYLTQEIKDNRLTEIPENFDVEDCTIDSEEKLKEEYEYQLKMASIMEYKQSLTKKEDQVLFDIYFSGDNTRDKIVERFKKQNKKVSTSTATRWIKQLRDDITAIYIKNGGTLGIFPQNQRKKK